MKKRPAETAGGLGGIGLAAAYLAGVRDPQALTYVGIVAGFLPAVVTALIDGGGLFGWARALWRGKSAEDEKPDEDEKAQVSYIRGP